MKEFLKRAWLQIKAWWLNLNKKSFFAGVIVGAILAKIFLH